MCENFVSLGVKLKIEVAWGSQPCMRNIVPQYKSRQRQKLLKEKKITVTNFVKVDVNGGKMCVMKRKSEKSRRI